MKEFVIVDYTTTDLLNPEVRVVNETELWKELDDAKEDSDIKIAVYEVGDCILDWS